MTTTTAHIHLDLVRLATWISIKSQQKSISSKELKHTMNSRKSDGSNHSTGSKNSVDSANPTESPELTSIQPKRWRSDADRRINQADRFAKILKLLELIQGNGRWNVVALAQEFECSEKTIYRYLGVLALAGIPYYFDRENQCYCLRSDYRFPALNLTDDELLEQHLSESVAKVAGVSLSTMPAPVTRKLSLVASVETQWVLNNAQRLMSVLGLQLANHDAHRETIKTVQWALIQGQQMSGRYCSPYEKKTITVRLHPYRLCLVKNAWYVVGKADQFDEVRTFRIARFRSLRMLDATAEIPEDFDLCEYFGNAWTVYRGSQSYNVRLRFTTEAAPIVCETTWHSTQDVRRNKDGSVTLNFTVDGLKEIVNWVLAWSGRVIVEKPVELRELVIAKWQASLEMNQQSQT